MVVLHQMKTTPFCFASRCFLSLAVASSQEEGDVCAQLAILLELLLICFYMRPPSELPAFTAVNDCWDPGPLPESRLSFTPSAVPKPMRSHPSPRPVVPGREDKVLRTSSH